MKLSYALKAGCAAVALVAGSGAFANPFFLDLGANYDLTGADKVDGNVNYTSMKTNMTYIYQSSTTITDNGDHVLGAGDTTNTIGGLSVGGFNPTGVASNQVNGFTPNQSLSANSNNGLNTGYSLSFDITGLAGVVTGMVGTLPVISYGPGLLKMYISFNNTSFDNFMNIDLAGGVMIPGTSILSGTVDFTGITSTYKNLFHSGTNTCGGSSGFYDIWNGCGLDLTIDFLADFNTDAFETTITPNAAKDPTSFLVASNHKGGGVFDIPEPGSLALLGLALAGLGMTQRRRKQA